MSANGIRHFLDLIDIPSKRTARDRRGKPRHEEAAARIRREPLAGKTLAMVFDKPSTRTRVSFDVGIRQLGGEIDHAHRSGDATWPWRNHCRHRARAVALRRWHHHPHARPQDCGGASAERHGAGHQWADTAFAPLPGHGGRHDFRGASRRDQRPHRGLDGRRQQRAGVLDARRGPLRVRVASGDAAGAQAEEMAA